GHTLRIILKHLRQHAVQRGLLERAGNDPTTIGILNIVGITANIGDQHRQAGNQGLQQYGAGIFVIGRMDQQVGAQQETRNVAAPLEKLHHAGNAQRLGLQLEGLGIILTDYQQARAPFQLPRQRGERLEAAVDALGLEAGADLHQQQVIGAKLEFLTKLVTYLYRVDRGTAILGNTRRQQVEAFGLGAVMFDEQRLLHFGNHQYFGLRLGREHRALVLGKMLVAAPATIDRVTQGLRLVLETG